MQQWQHAWSSSTRYQRRNAARADPNSYSLFTHNYAEEKKNENKEWRGRIKIASNEENKTESVFMTNNMKWETKSSVSAFSYWELSYATNVATCPPLLYSHGEPRCRLATPFVFRMEMDAVLLRLGKKNKNYGKMSCKRPELACNYNLQSTSPFLRVGFKNPTDVLFGFKDCCTKIFSFGLSPHEMV